MTEHPLWNLASALSQRLASMQFDKPVHTVYDPTVYASQPMKTYFERFGQPGKTVLFLGMNPGPWGMAQTGIPFGEINAVRHWLGIIEPVGVPDPQHPKRPIQGFDCPRSEVSGRRLWGGFADWFESADAFFQDHYIANYCPLAFMEESGRNRTPDKLPAVERAPLEAACDDHLRAVVEWLEIEQVIGVGRFAEQVARRALGDRVAFGTILHPSPASPIANRGWAQQAQRQLQELGIVKRA